MSGNSAWDDRSVGPAPDLACAASPLPVNVIKGDALEIGALAEAGVARISWGPRPWRWAMERLTEEARALYGSGGGPPKLKVMPPSRLCERNRLSVSAPLKAT